MRSDPHGIQSTRPSAHDSQETSTTVAIQSSLRPAHSFENCNFLDGFHRRARSAPPGLPAKGDRKGQGGICQELGDKTDALTIKNLSTLETCFPCTHFYHPDFEVVARNIPASRAQELKRILEAFTASLKSRKASHSGSDFRTHDGHGVVLDEGPKHDFAILHDPRPTTTIPIVNDNFAPPRASLFQAKDHAFADNVDSTTCTCLNGEAFDTVSSQFAASTDLIRSPNEPHCSTICNCQSSQKDVNESNSDSSVDFLYVARQNDPKSVRELEEEYDDMMKQVE